MKVNYIMIAFWSSQKGQSQSLEFYIVSNYGYACEEWMYALHDYTYNAISKRFINNINLW